MESMFMKMKNVFLFVLLFKKKLRGIVSFSSLCNYLHKMLIRCFKIFRNGLKSEIMGQNYNGNI